MARRRLTRQQQLRIRASQERRRQRLQERSAAVAEEQLAAGLGREQRGLVVANYGPAVIVEDEGEQLYRCALRQNLGLAVCGDRVVWQQSGEGEGVVIAIDERHNLLSRPDGAGHDKPIAANLDHIVVVIAPQPEIDEFLIDRYWVAITRINAQPLLAINKIDLLCESTRALLEQRLAIYRRLGCPLLWLSTKERHGIEALQTHLRRGTSLLVGQSGVGKSSLVKSLLPHREVRINALSQATGRGTHTTTTSTLYRLPTGGYLIDTPGVRSAKSFELGSYTLADLERGFGELAEFANHCRFANCRHDQEPGCAVQAAMAGGLIDPRRLASFHHLRQLLEAQQEFC